MHSVLAPRGHAAPSPTEVRLAPRDRSEAELTIKEASERRRNSRIFLNKNRIITTVL